MRLTQLRLAQEKKPDPAVLKQIYYINLLEGVPSGFHIS